ncbi:unnamed protein product [Orchesella dallaii]|uniref:Carboxylic ester hydrolase n=1 Tax=Orchesella dallaii TaxID=48710 RepID=A0ABP1PX18_9HEXA
MIKYVRQVYLYYFFAFLPFLVYTLVYFYLNNYFTELVHVQTVYGSLQGLVQTSRDGRKFYQFNSIPYANHLRFQPPTPLESWEGVKDATQMTPNCLQYDLVFKSFRGQEDCLFLNIYTPQDPTKPTKKLLPVLVFIHGGIFMLGGSGELYSGRYFMDEDVIVVTVNYRLGILGFLNTGDDVVSGNMGLKDQLEALKFVKRTIRDFGGDPNLITLWGESAGSVSVHLHMLSQQSKGLFQRAISQSGSGFSPWAFQRNPREQAVRLGNQFGCPTNNSEQLVECLSSLDPWELIQPQEKLLDIFIDPLDMFGPSVENVTSPELKSTAFLTDYPYKLAAEGRTHPVPWISGVNSHEGCYRSAWLVGAPPLLKRLDTDWDNVASSAFLLFRNDSQTFRKVRTSYFGEQNKEITIADYEPLTNLIGDRFFSIPARDAALLHAKLSGAPTYLYYFKERVDDSIGHFLSTLSDDSWMPRWLQLVTDVARRRFYEFLDWEIQDFGK